MLSAGDGAAASLDDQNIVLQELGYDVVDSVRRNYWWRTMYEFIRAFCRNCPRCAKASVGERKRAPLFPIAVTDPFRRVGIDIVSGLPTTYPQRNTCMVVFIDFFTKWVEIYPAQNHTARTIVKLLCHGWIRHNGVPEIIHTDNGPELVDHMMEEAHRSLEIKGVLSTAYHSQSLGVVERLNGTTIRLLRAAAMEDQQHWDEYIPSLEMALNGRVGIRRDRAKTDGNLIKVVKPLPDLPTLGANYPLTSGILCPLCNIRGKNEDTGGDWIGCAQCEQWIHCGCADLGSDPDQSQYFCRDCVNQSREETINLAALTDHKPPFNYCVARGFKNIRATTGGW